MSFLRTLRDIASASDMRVLFLVSHYVVMWWGEKLWLHPFGTGRVSECKGLYSTPKGDPAARILQQAPMEGEGGEKEVAEQGLVQQVTGEREGKELPHKTEEEISTLRSAN